jgi:hypothetical protein
MAAVNIISRKGLWTSYILSGLTTLFLLMEGIMKLFKPAFVVEGAVQPRYAESTMVGIATVPLGSTLRYIPPHISPRCNPAHGLFRRRGSKQRTSNDAALQRAVSNSVRRLSLRWPLLRDKRPEALLPLRSNPSQPRTSAWVCTREEAGELLEALRAAYLTLDPAERLQIKSFMSDLLEEQGRSLH